jgi:hypothetical protein
MVAMAGFLNVDVWIDLPLLKPLQPYVCRTCIKKMAKFGCFKNSYIFASIKL